jgi:hypothetical protein
MGRIKDLFAKTEEARFRSAEKDLEMTQQEWAQYNAEFNAWLDAYEQSYGIAGKEGEQPHD